jgi:hypothetical protein
MKWSPFAKRSKNSSQTSSTLQVSILQAEKNEGASKLTKNSFSFIQINLPQTHFSASFVTHEHNSQVYKVQEHKKKKSADYTFSFTHLQTRATLDICIMSTGTSNFVKFDLDTIIFY